jgi:hypothetical protein
VSCGAQLETRQQRRLELLLTLRRAHEELGRWPEAWEWEFATEAHAARRTLRQAVQQLEGRLPGGRPVETMSFTLLVPADDSQPLVLRELTEGDRLSASSPALRRVVGGGADQLAPDLWPVMLVDENGHAKGLPLNRRAGELYGANAIAGDALIYQERRSAFSVDELRGFTQEEVERLRDLVFRQTGRAAADAPRHAEGLDAIDNPR